MKKYNAPEFEIKEPKLVNMMLDLGEIGSDTELDFDEE